MGSCLGKCCGICLYCMSECTTRCHDEYMAWKWGRESMTSYNTIVTGSIQLQNTTKLQRLKSIHTAVIDKNSQDIKKIIEEQPESANTVNNYGETALHLACKLGYKNSIEMLLECQCPADICTEIGTPLHCIAKAVKTGYLTNTAGVLYMRQLVQRGVDIDAVDKGQKTVLFLAAENGHFELIDCIMDLGASVNCRDVNGFTPLYMSAIRSDIECMNLLLSSKDTEVDACDESGRTPLIASLITIMNNLRYERLACNAYNIGQSEDDTLLNNRYCRIGVVEALLRAGANPNETDSHSRSALVIAFVILEMDNIRGIASIALSNPTGPQSRCSLQKSNFTDTQMILTCPESEYTPLVRMLVLSGARMPPTWDKDDSKSPPWMQQLYRESKDVWTRGLNQKPYRLIHLARVEIRAHLCNIKNLFNIDELPLPEKMKDYLRIRYY